MRERELEQQVSILIGYFIDVICLPSHLNTCTFGMIVSGQCGSGSGSSR